jgi:hypothetical protein
MLVVLVEHVDIAFANPKNMTVHVLDLTLPTNTIAGLQMVSVVKQGNGVGTYNGVTNGKAHSVVFRQKPVTGSITPLNEAVGQFNVFQVTNEHGALQVVGVGLQRAILTA